MSVHGYQILAGMVLELENSTYIHYIEAEVNGNIIEIDVQIVEIWHFSYMGRTGTADANGGNYNDYA